MYVGLHAFFEIREFQKILFEARTVTSLFICFLRCVLNLYFADDTVEMLNGLADYIFGTRTNGEEQQNLNRENQSGDEWVGPQDIPPVDACHDDEWILINAKGNGYSDG